MNRIVTLMALAAVAAVMGCSDPKPPKEQQPQISQKVRVQNLQARIEKTYRLSETESIKTVIVPGYPIGEKCIVYSNAVSSTMQCREILPSQQ